jgi:hypothetical protein
MGSVYEIPECGLAKKSLLIFTQQAGWWLHPAPHTGVQWVVSSVGAEQRNTVYTHSMGAMQLMQKLSYVLQDWLYIRKTMAY